MEKIALAGLLPEEIAEAAGFSQRFRGVQIFKWIGSGATEFSQMTNLPAAVRNELSQKAVVRSSSVSKILTDPDGTVKLQVALRGGGAIETVLLTDKDGRKTACVSCQAGCGMRCAFCMTGRLGFMRNLDAAEIVEQFLLLEGAAGRLDNIVFMGMGEPLLNLAAVRKAVSVLTDARGRALSARRITISTSGIIRGIYDLADNGPHVRLAVSLTTADGPLRSELMPVNVENPLHELREAVAYYSRKTGRRVTLEAVLLGGRNTGEEAAEKMAEFACGLDVNVNVIPWNPVGGLPFLEPSQKEVRCFVQALKQKGLNVSLRTRRGRNVGGACGQLGQTLFPAK